MNRESIIEKRINEYNKMINKIENTNDNTRKRENNFIENKNELDMKVLILLSYTDKMKIIMNDELEKEYQKCKEKKNSNYKIENVKNRIINRIKKYQRYIVEEIEDEEWIEKSENNRIEIINTVRDNIDEVEKRIEKIISIIRKETGYEIELEIEYSEETRIYEIKIIIEYIE